MLALQENKDHRAAGRPAGWFGFELAREWAEGARLIQSSSRMSPRLGTHRSLLDQKYGELGRRAHRGAEPLALLATVPFAFPEILERHLRPRRHVPLLFDAFWQVLALRHRRPARPGRLRRQPHQPLDRGHDHPGPLQLPQGPFCRPRRPDAWWWPTTCACFATSPAAYGFLGPRSPAAWDLVLARPGQAGRPRSTPATASPPT